VGGDKRADARFFGQRRGLLTGGVAAAIGFLRHRLLQGGFVDHHIRPARHLQRLRAGGGIAKDGQRFTRRRGPR
jgi:hypothetical protein